MMTCRDITELLSDLIEGELPLVTRLRVRWHLGLCRHCRAYLAQLRATIATLGATPAEPPAMDDATRAELLARFRSFKR